MSNEDFDSSGDSSTDKEFNYDSDYSVGGLGEVSTGPEKIMKTTGDTLKPYRPD